ncbi:ATP-dependent helicase [Candidatus Mycalebacterium sp.]
MSENKPSSASPSFPVENLNPEQFEAVCHTGGHILVFAGAGSGKTRVLTSRIAFLINEKGVSPSEILAVTFTNKAAREMKNRVENFVPDKISGIWLGTFHSICSRILRNDIEKLGLGYTSGFVIYDTNDQMSVLKKILTEMGIDEKILPPRVVRSRIERFKRDNSFPPLRNSFSPGEKDVLEKMEVMKKYAAALESANALDFNDLLSFVAQLFEKNCDVLEKYRDRFKHILVDEYQDTNRVQYQFIKMLGQDNAEICAVGDDSQSIYGWRGAEIKNILGFADDFPGSKIVHLEKNYRSTANILDASNAVIGNNVFGVKKNMRTDRDSGEPIGIYEARNEFDEADFVVLKIKSLVETGDFSPGDFAILYRTNSKSRLIEERFFKEDGISCVVVGALSFYARAEIKDLISYMRLLLNPADDAAVLRIINTPSRGIGGTTVEKLSEFASSNGISIMEAIRRTPQGNFLKERAVRAVGKFALMIENLSQFARGRGAAETLKEVVEKTGYREFLQKDENKKENVDEFVNSAHEFDKREEGEADFRNFVEQVALASDLDTETGDDTVKLMTLHASKGLEFPVVFIVGVNENVIPLVRDDSDIEEERRVFYVGMTRAKKRLFLCYPIQRNFYGKKESMISSQFFDEIPDELKMYENFKPAFRFRPETEPDDDTQPLFVPAPENSHEVADGFAAGGFVLHNKFGRGKIVKVEGMGDNADITVSFPSAGTKRILASFLKKL